MKRLEETILEMINHLIVQQPQLLPAIEQIILGKNKQFFDAKLLLELNHELLKDSHSQLRQDIFVLSQLGFKRNGYFVEFGATNGVDLSNSYLLENKFGWRGILAEPAKIWHDKLNENRTAFIEHKCVWCDSGLRLEFNQVKLPEFSTIQNFSSSDLHGKLRETGEKYIVETISLVDLLAKYNAPNKIDYLSIDTEGSEFEILNAFDFDRYQFSVITCEHNFTPMREKLYSLLTSKGYSRKYENLSKFDDWYVRNNI